MPWTQKMHPRRVRAARLELELLESREVLSTTLPSIALNDLGNGLYNGQVGGLYPNGTDTRPAGMETAAENIASQIMPLDAQGRINTTSGKIVLISIGMSNANLEWDSGPAAFEPLANADPSKNPKLAIVNGAQSGVDASGWANPSSSAWSVAIGRLQAAGLTADQVQVVWLKEAEAYPEQYGGFLPAAQKLQSDLEAIARNLKSKFPNVKIAYLSSRTHAFTTMGLNPEPYAFESGFAVKWTIQDQLNGSGNLNWDSTKGAVVAPLLSWGSYLWANGTGPRSDGFTWTTNDVQGDLTHPSNSGIAKIGQMLLAFFKTDPTSTPWFLRAPAARSAPSVTASANHTLGASGLAVQFNASAIALSGSTITQYAWTFDDGDFAYAPAPTKTFYAFGTYHVHLAVTDSAGNVTLTTITITITGGSGGQAQVSLLNVPATALIPAPGIPTLLPGSDQVWMSWPEERPTSDSLPSAFVPPGSTAPASITTLGGASSSRENSASLVDVFWAAHSDFVQP